jgi:ABC-type sugar transport system permease subunit
MIDEAMDSVAHPGSLSATQPAIAERLSTRRRREGRLGYRFALPLLTVFALFYLWPAFNTVVGSFFRWGLLKPWQINAPADWSFVGVRNYTDALSSERFWNAVVNTGVWLVLFPVMVTVCALLVSVLIWQLPRGGGIFRTAFILPMTISLAAAGVIWTFMYDPDFGVLPRLLEFLHLDFALDWGPVRFRSSQWLSDPGVIDLGFAEIRFINVSLVVAGFWAFLGFGVITITAGLTAVPDELVEAAHVDGARTRQVIRHVLVPALRGPLAIVATISVIFSLRTFDVVWVITQGGPVQDTETLAVLLWKQAFVFLDSPQAGLATAVAVIMSVVLVVGASSHLRNLARDGSS